MFLAFFPPLIARCVSHPDYLWVLLKQAEVRNPKTIAFMASPAYFKEYPFGNQPMDFGGIPFKRPLRPIVSQFKIYPLTALDHCEELRQQPMLDIFKRLLTEIQSPLVDELVQTIQQAQKERLLRALLSWTNSPSLAAAAHICGLPVIYNELGALRPHNFRATLYFDFQGVNGATSAEKDAQLFYKDYASLGKVNLLSLAEIRELLLARPVSAAPSVPSYAVGIPLQCGNDSNVIAFDRGMSLEGLIRRAQQDFPGQRILVRPHPRGEKDTIPAGTFTDTSRSAYEFFIQCEKVYTLNSSIAFECLLFNKPVRIFGDSPAAFLSMEKTASLSPDLYLSHLNYLFLCYLVPADFIFCEEYYTWRLTQPPLSEIFHKHLAYWKTAPRPLVTDARPSFFHRLKRTLSRWPSLVKNHAAAFLVKPASPRD